MGSGSPKRIKPKSYEICLLYNTSDAKKRLTGLSLATCNRTKVSRPQNDVELEGGDVEINNPDVLQLTVSDKMSCNYCDAIFTNRVEQRRHYKSDWHRYNLKMRLKGKDKVSEDMFEEMSGNISSLSGSDSDSDIDTDSDHPTKIGSSKKITGSPRKFIHSGYSTTDSESESGNQTEDLARRLPKVYFKNKDGELLSLYRCVLCHKKSHPSDHEDLVTMAMDTPNQMYWAVFMAAGGHFAGAIFNKNQMVAHKTFHRYVVRAKRGTAQGSRDSQGNAPKSAGASLRRYNESALIQEVQELIASWNEYIKDCDRIFLRAPSFNRKIFFSGKAPPFNKDDTRIRLIPFQTRRPTFNEVRRVYEVLASIECYGEESSLQDLIPISPPQVFNPETGQLVPKDESHLTPRQRKMLNKRLGTSPLALDDKQALSDTDSIEKQGSGELDSKMKVPFENSMDFNSKESKSALPEHVIEDGNLSSSTASDTELVETMVTINLMELKEFACKKPKRRKKSAKKSKNPPQCHTEPDSNIMDEEKYHLKNNLYTACKVGDKEMLKNMLAILFTPPQPSSSSSNVDNKTDVNIDSKPSDHATNDKPEDEGQSKETISEDIPATCDKSEGTSIEKEPESVDDSLENGKTVDQNMSETPECECVDVITDVDGANVADLGETRTGNKAENSDVLTEDDEDNQASVCDEPAKRDTNIENTASANANGPDNDSTLTEVCDKTKDDTGKSGSETSKLKNTVNSTLNLDSSKTISDLNKVWPDLSPVVTPSILNEQFGDNKTTFLHVASREGHVTIVTLLMEAGADPAIKDKGGQTPYMVGKDKNTRNEFRRFMNKWPDRFDYNKAQIPGPLTEEMENEKKRKEAERKKQQRKQRQELHKERKEIEEKKRAEEKEKERFLNLSDREKRALAAEKRLVSQITSKGEEKPILREMTSAAC
ncbi:Ankyrin repeat and zinc finger domain-containing protein 1 [Mactra antiquata]